MKPLVTYWVIGCVLVGLFMGWRAGECPNDRIPNADILTMIATWPIIPAGLVTYRSTGKKFACDAKAEGGSS